LNHEPAHSLLGCFAIELRRLFYRQISLPRHPEPELDQAQASYFSNLFAAAAASFNSVPQASLVPAVLPPLAPNVPAAVTVPLAPATAGLAALYDPVFGLIEAHRKAEAAHIASLREQERLEKADIWALRCCGTGLS
jgi:hypothetical protein